MPDNTIHHDDGATTDVGHRLDVADHVATITIDRVHRANAFTLPQAKELARVVDRLSFDDDVRVLVITGAGRHFSAGFDLHDAARPDVAEMVSRFPHGGIERGLYDVLLSCPKPTIAAINGTAVGGGLEVALACDLRIARAAAEIGLPEVRRGMGAAFACAQLPRLIPRALAFEVLYSGAMFPVERAAEWGLINRVVGDEDFPAQVRATAEVLARNAPLSMRRIKNQITWGADLPVSVAARLDVGANPYRSHDREEGIRAWIERRPPEWTTS